MKYSSTQPNKNGDISNPFNIQWKVALTDLDGDGNPDTPESKTINITVIWNNSARTAEFVFVKHNDSDEL